MTISALIRRFLHQFRHGGVRWLASAVFNRLVPPTVKMRETVLAALTDKQGLEIGGPSKVFFPAKILPVYRVAARIDNVNFATKTAWEDGLRDGGAFHYNPHSKPGTQWIRDAHILTGIADETYDFILSSHCLEHLANPLLALREWLRVLKPGGYLLIILPDPAGTFDHKRPLTTIEHLIDDERTNTDDSDLTHLDEILALHDLKRDPMAGTMVQFRERSLKNAENRCLHHHVFDLTLLQKVLALSNWEVVATEKIRPVHLVALARKHLKIEALP